MYYYINANQINGVYCPHPDIVGNCISDALQYNIICFPTDSTSNRIKFIFKNNTH